MGLSKSRKGSDKERRILNKFKELGWIGARSAGSHSIVDIWVINPKTKEIKLIQSKLRGRKNLCNKERNSIIKEGEILNGIYEVRFELWE